MSCQQFGPLAPVTSARPAADGARNRPVRAVSTARCRPGAPARRREYQQESLGGLGHGPLSLSVFVYEQHLRVVGEDAVVVHHHSGAVRIA